MVLLVLVLVLLVAGCSSPPPAPETPAEREARVERTLEQHPKLASAWYERGQIDEEKGDLEKAVSDYGAAVSLLPPRRETKAAFALGRVHAKLGHDEPARRILEEVVTTVPPDATEYKTNRDYHDAALLLKGIYERKSDARALEKLRVRFLEEFGGTASEWP
jgi:cytochrome c-type biogenesis protein CcmH/NrfG